MSALPRDRPYPIPTPRQHTVNQNHPGRPDPETRTPLLVRVVRDAREVLSQTGHLHGDRFSKRGSRCSQRILQENIQDDASGSPKEKDHKAKPRTLPGSTIDPMARYGPSPRRSVYRLQGQRHRDTELALHHQYKACRHRRRRRTMVVAIAERSASERPPLKLIGHTGLMATAATEGTQGRDAGHRSAGTLPTTNAGGVSQERVPSR